MYTHFTFTLMAHCTSEAIRGSVSCSRTLRQGIELATFWLLNDFSTSCTTLFQVIRGGHHAGVVGERGGGQGRCGGRHGHVRAELGLVLPGGVRPLAHIWRESDLISMHVCVCVSCVAAKCMCVVLCDNKTDFDFDFDFDLTSVASVSRPVMNVDSADDDENCVFIRRLTPSRPPL